MTYLKKISAALAFASLSGMALAAANPLSVHILDLQSGLPTAGVTVTLEQKQGKGQDNDWKQLASGVTNAQGRIAAMYPVDAPMQAGDYRIVFKTGEHYARLKQETFFPEIPVQFHVEKTEQHYHIPLLLSPFGFSTYRGN
ncbi:hydroxyisourate hydrolase [Janthinobacterium sp. NKUCC06_STL]|uniref:hydroxyisourate hydrolase n=1 Tax=Janthinobacterium sp. NKUCC06_STL TaxID=2842127 RepID=UPI001C5B57EC|nr:hydroxyisourate hydrolase [Janthinobacterium sp. NKUCC06_STL]MBW3511955.1 hydroxyisourate hydrolase [Janthinobacterium sp. NKUCC06_STL]